MSLTRAFDDRMVAMWKQGRGVGGTFSQRGHEAVSVGAATALADDDVVAPLHRDLGSYLVRGLSPERVFSNLLGKADGVTRGRDANLHGMGDLSLGIIGFVSHIGLSMPVALGAAMAFQQRNERRAALTFIGDGGSSTGVWHETLNMAAVVAAPLVVIVENNQYAYSTPLNEQMAITDIADRAAGYGMPGIVVDGNDVEAVHHVTSAALDRARGGGGPTLIEAKTMRMLGHAIHDGAEYVPAELLERWKKRDPLAVYRARLTADGVGDDELRWHDDRAKSVVDAAVKHAEAAPLPDPSKLLDGVYAQ
ncbi:MAG: thiamine pyrophosphate-dependent dehydrogenase E1 component subunit alpha [Acidimicrobiia bacterium]|nr:thiamine pyrophosphate-dependent dehydrogenase E1 component subunit alpha [Acidimicrobiia bacterium]